MRPPLTVLALACIRLYQRHVSPRKGYGCAYRIHCGHASCSALGFRAIRRYGVWRGLPVLRERLLRCGEVYRARRAAPLHPAALRQAGFCDGCDLPVPDLSCGDCQGSDMLDCGCDAADCGSDLLDWGNEDRKKRRRGRHEELSD